MVEQVRHGLIMLSQRILGPNTVIQGAVKTILNSTPQQFFDASISLVQVSDSINITSDVCTDVTLGKPHDAQRSDHCSRIRILRFFSDFRKRDFLK